MKMYEAFPCEWCVVVPSEDRKTVFLLAQFAVKEAAEEWAKSRGITTEVILRDEDNALWR